MLKSKLLRLFQYPLLLGIVSLLFILPLRADGNAVLGKAKAVSCGACHGSDGISRNSNFPDLAGKDNEYILTQLKAFKSGARKSDIMSAMASTLSDTDMLDVAAFFSSLNKSRASSDTAKAFIEDSRTLFSSAASWCKQDFKSVTETSQSIKRLSKDEYKRTLWDLLSPEVANSLPAISGLISGIPNDDMTGGFANVDWSLSPDHVKSYLGVANEIGVELASDLNLRKQVLACSKKNNNDTSEICIENFIEQFGMRVYRRPLEKDEKSSLIDFWRQSANKNPDQAFSILISRMLMSPHFLFRRETGLITSHSDCSASVIDENFNAIERLSYGFWGTMPDEELFAAATDENFLFSDKLNMQIDRMLKHTKTKEWVNRFFRQWLHYEELPVEGYTWDFINEIDRANLHEYAALELENFINTIVWDHKGSFSDLMTSRLVITDASAIRQIYGLPETSSSAEEMVPNNRAGVLTRAVKLMNGHNLDSPIRRGKFIRQQLLCEPLRPPDTSLIPPGSLVPPKPDHKMTTRQRWELKTGAPLCQSCHQLMNPFGFSLEAYDGLGRYRMTEQLKIPNTNPEEFIERMIDTVIMPNIDNNDEPVAHNAVELSHAIGQSEKANRCFVKQLATYVNGREVSSNEYKIIQELSERLISEEGNIYNIFRKYMRYVALSGLIQPTSLAELKTNE